MKAAITGLVMALSGTTSAQTATTSAIDTLVEMVMDHRHESAFRWAEQHIEWAGEPRFDFYYGIAAVESGQPSIGVFALERYLAAYPENRTARFYLARGYFILGEDALARAEFEQLLETANRAENAVILQYLDGIWEREGRYFPRFRLVAEFGMGRDDNVNDGVDTGPVKGLPLLTVGENSSLRGVAGHVVSWNVGVAGSRPLAPGVTWLGHARAGGYRPLRHTQFDERHVVAGMGLAWESGRHLWRSGLEHRTQWTDGQRLLDANTWFADWHFRSDQFQRWGAALSWSDHNFRDIEVFNTLDRSAPRVTTNDGERDSHLWQLSGHHTRYFSHPWAPAWKNTVLVGQERNRRDRPSLSRDFWGVHSTISLRPADRWLAQASIGFLRSDHRAPYDTGLAHREDRRWQVTASLSYRWSARWRWIGEWSHLNQRSNIGLHDHDRQHWLLKARYEFK